VLSILAEYRTYENLQLDYPGRFEYDQLKDYFGAEIKKDGVKNDIAKKLDEYYQSVVSGEFTDEEAIKYVEILDLSTGLSDTILDTCEVVIVHLDKEDDLESVLDLLKKRLLLERESLATLVLFPSEDSQFKALSCVRGLESKDISLKIRPLLFHGVSQVSGEFDENLKFGLLVGSFSVSTPPLKIFHNSILSLSKIVDKICTAGSDVAFITGQDVQSVQIHSSLTLPMKVTYFGTSEEMSKLEIHMEKADSPVQSVEVSKKVPTSEVGDLYENQISISPAKGNDRSQAGTSKVLTFEEKV
jgi:hypothetical protein